MSNDGPAFVAATAHTDDKFGLADRLRDSALLIRDQISGEEGEAVYLDLELLADEIEEMESTFENGNGDARSSFLSFTQDDGRGNRDLLNEGVELLTQAVQSSIGPPAAPLSKKRQQANKK